MKSNMRFQNEVEESSVPSWLDIAKSYGSTIILTIAILVAFVFLSGCKKSTKQPEPAPIEQPQPTKGNMEGEYIWFAGDTAVANLKLTTDYLNKYNSLIGSNVDRYDLNQSIGDSYGEATNKMIFAASWNKDTINISTNHWYRFVRKK